MDLLNEKELKNLRSKLIRGDVKTIANKLNIDRSLVSIVLTNMKRNGKPSNVGRAFDVLTEAMNLIEERESKAQIIQERLKNITNKK